MRSQQFYTSSSLLLHNFYCSAEVSANIPEYSRFDLELRGTTSQIESALTYLDELDLEVLHQSNPEEDG